MNRHTGGIDIDALSPEDANGREDEHEEGDPNRPISLQDRVNRFINATGIRGRIEEIEPETEEFPDKAKAVTKFGASQEMRESLIAYVKAQPDSEDALEDVLEVLGINEDGTVASDEDRIEAKNIDADVVERFMGIADKFKEAYEAAEKYVADLDTEIISDIARRSGSFASYARVLGTESIVTIWKERLPHLALRDPERFEKFKKAFDTYEEKMADWEDFVKERADKIGTSTDLYQAVLSIEDDKLRKQKMQEILNHSHGHAWGRVKQFASGLRKGEINADKIAKIERDKLEEMVLETDREVEKIAHFFKDLEENPYARIGFIEELRRNAPAAPAGGPRRRRNRNP